MITLKFGNKIKPLDECECGDVIKFIDQYSGTNIWMKCELDVTHSDYFNKDEYLIQ